MNPERTTTIPYPFTKLIKDVWRFIKPYRWRFIGGSIADFVSDLAWLYPAVAVAAIVNFFAAYHPGDSARPLWIVFWLWGAASLARFGGLSLARYLCFQVGERVSLDARLKAIKHLFAVDLAWHERENAGNKIKRLDKGGEGYNQLIRIWVTNIIEIAVNFIGVTIVISLHSIYISIALLIFIIVYAIVSSPLLRRSTQAAQAVDEEDERFEGLSFEAVNNIRSVKVLGLAENLSGRITASAAELFSRVKRRIFWFQLRFVSLEAWGRTTKMLLLAATAYYVLRGWENVGFLMLVNYYFNRITESIGQFTSITQEIIISKNSIARLEHMLAVPINIDDDTAKLDFPTNWKTLSLKNVSFAYGANIVLKNISFTIKRGERWGIVGLSGAGKSTLFKLLLKEEENYRGEILIDNIPLKQIKRSSFFHYAAVVLQETEVFNFSLHDNITITREAGPANALALASALKTAHVDDFLDRLPQGVDTLIGEKGVKLSGGEKQRLGIARAIYKQPQLLFLDEATSHLDLESEEKIKDSLHRFFQDVTAFVIAHRLTTIQEMDHIILIENGEILESGDFKTLHKKHGRFFALWEKQRL